jgi:hypothetical protein
VKLSEGGGQLFSILGDGALKPVPIKIIFSASHTILLYYLGHNTEGGTSKHLQICEMIETQMSLETAMGLKKLYDMDSLQLPVKTLTICGQAAGLSLATRKRAGEGVAAHTQMLTLEMPGSSSEPN